MSHRLMSTQGICNACVLGHPPDLSEVSFFDVPIQLAVAPVKAAVVSAPKAAVGSAPLHLA